ncbi:Predicted glycosyl hydrolase [Legionella wadsworthii]|uniref:Predicted glycosyl hydrolase n=1 Tax=Legionella wadsworthii TaxID=28088 RepID=A0A378LSD0_9GAMM|nr:glycosyltransferase family A protein [Legionella wadsworthii]STY29644.1 Predicted glycosyl hydrolase [Legionella wadsworthii]
MNINTIYILIPARNEEDLLPRCLSSLLKASSVMPSNIQIETILCVDASTDKTFEIGTKILNKKGTVLNIDKENVGAARRYAAQYALSHYSGPLEYCWIANTDADCKIPLNWLQKQIVWANQRVHAIKGIIKVDSYAQHCDEVSNLFEKDYNINEDGTHPHIHGSNLGIRADVYQDVGGWSELPTAEDHDLWNRLSRLNLNLVSDASLFVMTSGRKMGRAPLGFADKLDSYNKQLDTFSKKID